MNFSKIGQKALVVALFVCFSGSLQARRAGRRARRAGLFQAGGAEWFWKPQTADLASLVTLVKAEYDRTMDKVNSTERQDILKQLHDKGLNVDIDATKWIYTIHVDQKDSSYILVQATEPDADYPEDPTKSKEKIFRWHPDKGKLEHLQSTVTGRKLKYINVHNKDAVLLHQKYKKDEKKWGVWEVYRFQKPTTEGDWEFTDLKFDATPAKYSAYDADGNSRAQSVDDADNGPTYLYTTPISPT